MPKKILKCFDSSRFPKVTSVSKHNKSAFKNISKNDQINRYQKSKNYNRFGLGMLLITEVRFFCRNNMIRRFLIFSVGLTGFYLLMNLLPFGRILLDFDLQKLKSIFWPTKFLLFCPTKEDLFYIKKNWRKKIRMPNVPSQLRPVYEIRSNSLSDKNFRCIWRYYSPHTSGNDNVIKHNFW